MPELLPHWFIPAALALFGACVGSFLNVAIYRTPLGLSINDPARSFCPGCKTPIPWYLNIPILSWLLLRGKCAHCKMGISVRYWIVEVLTMGLFLTIALSYDNIPVVAQISICLWAAMAVVIAFIDGETMLVFPRQTLLGALFGLIACSTYPLMVGGLPGAWTEGLAYSLIGAVSGFVMIRVIIEIGKLFFGSWKKSYEERGQWHLKEPASDHEELLLVLPDRECPWSELFSRPADKAILKDATLAIDGDTVTTDTVTIFDNRIETSEGEAYKIEDIKSAEGSLMQINANREAMGSGDAWIMLMIGALCGWQGCLFSLVCASFLSIIIAVIGRLGFGRPMPFGPSLLASALVWLFGGKQLWIMYLQWVGV